MSIILNPSSARKIFAAVLLSTGFTIRPRSGVPADIQKPIAEDD
jgi:hypothetical protein